MTIKWLCSLLPLLALVQPAYAKHANCAVVGDSIATHAGLGGQFPHCYNSAHVGIGSAQVVHHVIPRVDYEIISVGSNDPFNPHLETNLLRIRHNAKGVHRIIWVVPQNTRAANVISDFALQHGDTAVGFAAGPDGIHPASYPFLANEIKYGFEDAD